MSTSSALERITWPAEAVIRSGVVESPISAKAAVSSEIESGVVIGTVVVVVVDDVVVVDWSVAGEDVVTTGGVVVLPVVFPRAVSSAPQLASTRANRTGMAMTLRVVDLLRSLLRTHCQHHEWQSARGLRHRLTLERWSVSFDWRELILM